MSWLAFGFVGLVFITTGDFVVMLLWLDDAVKETWG